MEHSDEKNAMVNPPAIKKNADSKAGAPVKCKLRFKGLILYGRAVRKINGRRYDLSIDQVTFVEAQDLEALKKQEPNLHIIAK